MAELNLNDSTVSSNVAGKEDVDNIQAFTFQDIIEIVLKKWYWFAASVFAFLLIGGVYLMRTSPVYQRNATIMVKDSRKGSGSTEMAAFSELAGLSSRRNVDNELFVLQARRLMLNVVDKLNLTVNYTTRQGLRTVDLYKRSPIAVTFVNNNENAACSFRVKLGENDVEISHFSRSKQKGEDDSADKHFAATAPYGETIVTPNGEIVVDKTLYMDETYVGRTINVSKQNREVVAARYRTATQSAVANKMSSIINISLKDVVAKRAEDVINTLIDVYNSDAVYDKQQIAEATADFIDARLLIISKELGSVDSDIQSFKNKNNMVDIEAETKRNMTESSKLKEEGLSVDSQIEMAKFIKDYLNDSDKECSLIPVTNTGENSSVLSKQIADYNELVLRREKLMQNGATNNPVIQQLDRDRTTIRNSILASLDSNIATLEIKRDNLRREENKTNTRISSVPSQEKEYLSIARQQRIKEELYLYLLNKREENAISLAITENSARIIDSAFGPLKPISPRKPIIMLLMLVLGFAVPFSIVYLREMFNTAVRGRRDIERCTSVPYLGDIPVFEGKMHRSVAVRENGRDNVSEAFRIIRTNMTFMNAGEGRQQVIQVTSSNAHAGKTFISTNLGMTIAFSGQKVLMIDLDLRRRTMSKHMGQRNNPNGVSRYISDRSIHVKDIIAKSGLHENFDCIYAGLQPPNPAEMLLSSRLDELIAECRKLYDTIIIDSVPALVIADALITSRIADLCLYVVREGLLDRRQLPDIDALYREKKLHNMCVILNGASERNHRYGYGYTYTYDSDGDEPKSRWQKIFETVGLGNIWRRYSSKHSIY